MSTELKIEYLPVDALKPMELDPRYCDVIVDRWEKLTGQKAEICRGETEEA